MLRFRIRECMVSGPPDFHRHDDHVIAGRNLFFSFPRKESDHGCVVSRN